jgi:TolB-like protein/Tfp pilus assembly protein PilF
MPLFNELKRRNVFRVGAVSVIITVLVLVILMMAAERVWMSPAVEPVTENRVAVAEKPAKPNRTESAHPAAADKSIAVLPFVNLSAGTENSRFFSDGIHDDLLTKLSKIRELKVISRTSVMAYRDTTKTMREIGDELGVANLLEGSVQQAGDRVRIDVQLINAQTDEHLWGEIYDRKITAEDIFEIQGEIARAIAKALDATLTRAVDDALGRAPTDDLEAYRAVLMSRQIARRGKISSYDRGVEYARKAIRLDPDYADAHLALAFILSQSIDTGAVTDDEAGKEISTAIDKAMSLEPDYDEAWSVLGSYLASARKPGADESFEKAMLLNPGNARTMSAFGFMLQSTGRPREALPLLLKSIELDPLSTHVIFALGRTYEVLEEYEKARTSYTRIQEIDPSNPLGYAPISGTYYSQGQLDQALYWLRKGLAADPRDFEMGGWMLFLNDCLEDYVAAQQWSDWLDETVTNQPQPMAMQARHHYLTGNFETAIQYANLALNLGLPNRGGSDGIFMRIKRDEALANGDPEAGIGVFRAHHPELFESKPEITPVNILQAVDLALLLKMTGRTKEMRRTLEAVFEFYDQPWSTTGSVRSWLVPAKAEALALLDDEQGALAELRRIIDDGWRLSWRWETDLNSNFNGIRETAGFQAMLAELEADIAVQRASSQAMADNGEIAPPPEIGLNRLRETNFEFF